MLGRFGRDAGSLLGVEITPPFIRLVMLQRQRGRYRVQGWGLEPLPITAMHNGWIGDPERVGQALRQAIQRAGINARRVAVALPGGLVIEKLLAMPINLDDEAIAERLPVDAGQFIPFALEDAAIDFKLIDLDPDDAQQQRIVVAACHQALLDVLYASLESAGLRACVVEPDSHALLRAAQIDGECEGLLLQVEGSALVFHEPDASPLPLRREFPLQGHLDLERALTAAVDNYLLSSPDRALPSQLLLSGAGAVDINLPVQLQQRLGIETRHITPFAGLSLAPGVDSALLMAQGSSLAVACGLAMREGERCMD